eukprot:583899-Pleurochrysis_carterae.AAC.2
MDTPAPAVERGCSRSGLACRVKRAALSSVHSVCIVRLARAAIRAVPRLQSSGLPLPWRLARTFIRRSTRARTFDCHGGSVLAKCATYRVR